MFGSFFYVLVFLSLKYRTHLQEKTRDPVLHASAMATTLFATMYITSSIVGLSFFNPVIAMTEALANLMFIQQPQAVPLNSWITIIRCLGPFTGSVIAGIVHIF